MSIVVHYSNGTTESYSSVTGYTNDGKIVKFTGKITNSDGSIEATARERELNWDKITKIDK